MKLVIQVITVATAVLGFANGQAAQCTIESCVNGDCVQGSADYSDHPLDANGQPFEFLRDTDRDGWRCDCPDGFVGLRCARQSEKCGNTGHYCYHGGKCIEGLESKVGNDQLYCDCQDAVYNGFPYVGKYCEHKGAVQCGDTEIFCSNGGTCADGFETRAHPCDCPEGHRGPHCEFLTGQVPDCNLDCNGGTCQLGIKDYDTAVYNQFWALHDGNFQYCDCPEGFFGPQCEIEGEECGDNHCFNGANCVQTLSRNGTESFNCDCNSAATNQASFAGQYCQSESTTFCNKEADHNGHLFCTNGGTCKEETHEGCECPEGFHGPICEFHDEIPVQTCSLSCQNGGRCRKGTKDNQIVEQYGAELSKFNMTHSELWEHCVCPEGFFGIQCEHKLEICPGGDHVCLHGSRCVPTEEATGGTGHTCDCDSGSSDGLERYAGKFCQYSSTDICTLDGRPGAGKANFAFCVNNGTCKKKVGLNKPHPGCNCPQGFKGEHCEFLDTPSPTSAPGANKNEELSYNPNEGLVIGLVIAVIALAGILVFAMYQRSLARGNETAKDIAAAENAPPPAGDAITEVSEPSGPTPFEAEGTDAENAGASPQKADMQTVEII